MQSKVRGLALLEVLMAMAVLALGLTTCASLLARGAQAFDSAGRESLALQGAQSLLERVRAQGRLTVADELGWRSQLVERLGVSAQGRVNRSAQMLQVQVLWPAQGGEQVLTLHGGVLP